MKKMLVSFGKVGNFSMSVLLSNRLLVCMLKIRWLEIFSKFLSVYETFEYI